MSSSPVHSRGSVSSKRRRPAPLSLVDDDELSSGSSAQSSPTTHTPRRSSRLGRQQQPLPSPARHKPALANSSLPSTRSRYHTHNLRSRTPSRAAGQQHKLAGKWGEQALLSAGQDKCEAADATPDGQYSADSAGEGGGRRLGLRVSVTDEDRELSRAHSSPPSLLTSHHHHASAPRDSDDDSPYNAFKRQRTAPTSPSQVSTPPTSPFVSVSYTASTHYSYAVQPSPSPLLRQLTLESDSPPPALDESFVSEAHVSTSTMYFSRPLSLIIEEAEDIIVPVPYTATPHPSPASPAASPRRSREGRLLSLPYAAVTMKRGVRKTQQDAFVCRGEHQPLQPHQPQQAGADECAVPESFFAVLDGHGVEGGKVSVEASTWLPTYFFASLHAASDPSSPASTSSSVSSVAADGNGAVGAAFDASFAMTDHLVCEEKGYRGGTTACCAYLSYQHPAHAAAATDSPSSLPSSLYSAHSARSSSTGLTLHLASVGDSRAILFSSTRPPRLLTTDHSTSSLSEQARISAAGGHLLFSHSSLRVNGVLNVTRSIGDRALKQFVISQPLQAEVALLETDDTLLLVSDGVSNAVTLDEMQAAVAQQQGRPSELSDRLVDLALQRGSKDNVTAVCVHIPTYLAHLRTALSAGSTPPPSLLATDAAETAPPVCTPPPSRERREAANLPPVPPFTCSPTPSSPSPSLAGSTLVCSVRSAERSVERDSGSVWRKAPLTSRSRLSTSFFAMLPDSVVAGRGVEDDDEANVSIVVGETTEVLC